MTVFGGVYLAGLLMASMLFWCVRGPRLRTWFLIVASTVALSSIAPVFTVFLLGLVGLVHAAAGVVQARRIRGGASARLQALLLGALVLVLLVFKYGPALYLGLFDGESEFALAYLVPIGLSYLIFKLIAFLADVYRGEITDPRFEDLLVFIVFVPTFPAGPIERFNDFTTGRAASFDLDRYLEGLARIAMGFFKKIVLVNFLLDEAVFHGLRPAAYDLDSSGYALVVVAYLVGALVYAALDLSAYADIAIGFGRLFGYRISENMNHPLLRPNLAEFWNCWHITLAQWCRNYVYFPVIGWSRNHVLALYCSFIVMGLWHQVNLAWLLWGLWHASGLALYGRWTRALRKRRGRARLLPRPVAHVLGTVVTVVYAALGLSFVVQPTVLDALDLMAGIVGLR